MYIIMSEIRKKSWRSTSNSSPAPLMRRSHGISEHPQSERPLSTRSCSGPWDMPELVQPGRVFQWVESENRD